MFHAKGAINLFCDIIDMYQDLFDPQKLGFESNGNLPYKVFMQYYSQVATRSFEYDKFKGSAMVPLAEQLNHNDKHMRFELVNRQLHLTEKYRYYMPE